MTNLTSRQREVVVLLAEGLSGPRVAKQLGISLARVDQHRHQAYIRLGISSIVELVHYALAHGWVRNRFAGPGRPRKER